MCYGAIGCVLVGILFRFDDWENFGNFPCVGNDVLADNVIVELGDAGCCVERKVL